MSEHKRISIQFERDRLEQIEEAAEDSGYNSRSAYLRSVIEAGESNIAALDPRTSNTDSSTQKTHNTAEAAGKSLSDAAIINELADGKDNKAQFDEVVESLIIEFEDTIAARLNELSQEDNSPVTTDGRGNYWREADQ
ncbi:hypothetical protein [Halorubrum tibetense]|uniref:Ribbon-helix-helix protein CopG domain-containing protein n=1 Tax=Halorubrum tibetense TaxID=175631 RepID=A0ABD5S6F8_9EURY